MKDNNDLNIASSEEDSSNDSGDNDIHLTKKQIKEKNFRLSLAQHYKSYREILKCKNEDEFQKSLDSLSHKSLSVLLKCTQNVYKGNNVKVISTKKFRQLKSHEKVLVEKLSQLKITKLKKQSVKDVLKSLKLPLLKCVLKIHKKCGISDYEY